MSDSPAKALLPVRTGEVHVHAGPPRALVPDLREPGHGLPEGPTGATTLEGTGDQKKVRFHEDASGKCFV